MARAEVGGVEIPEDLPPARLRGRTIQVSRRDLNRLLSIGAFGVVALAVGLTGRPDYAQLVFSIMLTVTFGVTWNIIGGLGGQHSFGQPIFFGVGAYVGALLLAGNSELPLPIAMIAGATAATVVAAALSPCFRARGPYFAILTVAVAVGLRIGMNAYGPGGAGGLYLSLRTSPSPLVLLGLGFAVLALACTTYYLFERGKSGIGLRLIDIDEDAATAIGVPTVRLKIIASVAGAPFVGAMGPLFAVSQTFIDPNSVFDLNFAIAAILSTLLGGIGIYWGPLVGGVVWQLLSQELRGVLNDPGIIVMLNGLILLAVIVFLPRGLVGLGGSMRRLGILIPVARGSRGG